MNQDRTPAGVPTGGQFAASARTESDVTLDESQGKASGSMAYRSVEEDHEFYDALVMAKHFDTTAEAALAEWETATSKVARWRLGSKKKAATARTAASTAVSRKTLNDAIIKGYVARHGVPDWAVQHMPTTPDTDPS